MSNESVRESTVFLAILLEFSHAFLSCLAVRCDLRLSALNSVSIVFHSFFFLSTHTPFVSFDSTMCLCFRTSSRSIDFCTLSNLLVVDFTSTSVESVSSFSDILDSNVNENQREKKDVEKRENKENRKDPSAHALLLNFFKFVLFLTLI